MGGGDCSPWQGRLDLSSKKLGGRDFFRQSQSEAEINKRSLPEGRAHRVNLENLQNEKIGTVRRVAMAGLLVRTG